MSELCEQAQDALADGIEAMAPDLREHVADCDECSGVLLALASLDGELAALEVPPRPEGLDARVAEAVRELAEAAEVELEPEVEPAAVRPWWRRPPPLWSGLLAAGLVLMVSMFFMTLQVGGNVQGLFETADAEIDTVDSNLGGDDGWRPFAGMRSSNQPAASAAPAPPAEDAIADLGADFERGEGGGEGFAKAGRLDRQSAEWKAMDPDGDGIRAPQDSSGKNLGDVFRPQTRQRIQKKREKRDDLTILTPRSSRGRRSYGSPQGDVDYSLSKQEAAPKPRRMPRSEEERPRPSEPVLAEEAPEPEPEEWADEPADIVLRELSVGTESGTTTASPEAPPPPPTVLEKEKDGKKRRLTEQAANKGLLALIGTTGEAQDESVADLLSDLEGEEIGLALAGLGGQRGPSGYGLGLDEGRYRLGWLNDRAQLEVPTVAAAGYWANTYTPGDPALRGLESRVRNRRGQRLGLNVDPSRLDLSARRIRQPFDAPTDGALAVYLHADRRGVTEPTRMRIQVGLQGTERGSGRRPAMNVGVVLDLRGSVSTDDAQAMRSLIDALLEAKDLGDTFSVTVAGRPGAQAVPGSDFRYGPVRLAMEGLFGESELEGPTLSLPAAMEQAIDSVGATDDPNRPLGSSVVLLVSPASLSADVNILEAMAHRSAVAGIPVSVVGVGRSADLTRLETIALAGQGNRRLLPDGSQAESVVDRELSAASRVVARAVRLRIRLAPGVKLVDVLGSHNLDAARAQRVREAEQSIDRRLSRNLGIQADRGDDEEGIQIVIPTWYAGDGHAILLDVIAPGPGAIADVSVKYKDLVRLNNGVARASLSLGRDPRPPGPLELNVLKNEVAHELSGRLASAADLVRDGRAAEGARAVREAILWIDQLALAVPALHGDRELERDKALLAAYGSALDGSPSYEANQFLTDSLRLAARRKVLAPLADDTEGAP